MVPSAPLRSAPAERPRRAVLARVSTSPADTSPAEEDGEVYWRAITQRLSKIEFNANDGLDRVELALIASEFASMFDADGDGKATINEIAREPRAGRGLAWA